MTEVVVSGASGRLGARILERCQEADDLEVVGALVRPNSPFEGEARGGLRLESDAQVVLQPGRVLLEAALVPAALEHLAMAASVGIPACVATTGFDGPQRRRMESFAEQIPLVVAPNLSLGVNVLVELVRKAAAALADYDLEVLEMHHGRKRDAPSGTAWALARAGAEARGRDIDRDAILARAGDTGSRGQHEVGIQTLRGGDVVGEHTVYLVGPTERVELTHRAATRDVFAAGATQAARFLSQVQRPGLYGMGDVLGL